MKESEQKQQESPKGKLAKYLDTEGKLNLALFGSAVQSCRRGLAWEHRMIEDGENPDVEDGTPSTELEGDEMGPLIIGDISITEGGQQPEQRQPDQQQQTKTDNQKPTSPKPKGLIRRALPYVLATVLGGSGVGLPLLVSGLLGGGESPPKNRQPEIPEFKDTDTIGKIRFVEPKTEVENPF